MPPQREIFRQTASATPAPSAPGSAAVSSIATRTATRSRTSRTACEAVDRLLDELEPGRRERVDRAHRLLDAPRAVGVQAQRDVRAGRGARPPPRAPASSPTPDLELQAREARRDRAAAACSAAPPRSSAVIVALTGTPRPGGRRAAPRSGVPALRPARSHSAMSIGRERLRQVVGRAACFESLRPPFDAVAAASTAP